MKSILYTFFIAIVLYGCSSDMPFEQDEVSATTRTVNADSTYYFSFESTPVQELFFSHDGSSGYHMFKVVSYFDNGIWATGILPEVLGKPSWVNVNMEQVSATECFVAVEADDFTGTSRTGNVTIMQPESGEVLSWTVSQYGYQNTISIISEAIPGQKAYNLRLVASYPMIAGANVFRVRYMVVKDGMTSEEYALFTLLPGEKETSTMINGNGYSSYYLTRLVDVEAHAGDYYHYTYSFSYR